MVIKFFGRRDIEYKIYIEVSEVLIFVTFIQGKVSAEIYYLWDSETSSERRGVLKTLLVVISSAVEKSYL